MHNSMIAGLSKSQMYEQRDQLVEQITAILQSKATLAEMQDKCRCIKYDGESLAPKFIDLFWIYCKIPTQIFMSRLFFFLLKDLDQKWKLANVIMDEIDKESNEDHATKYGKWLKRQNEEES